ncbi:unnamed protein product [Symbiodinium natans]|uniref:Uncharacterized protein n=1 Tax=Symbiodinium natans TaxID=878477 RepID=A0A812MIV2_9DINO|nr:unnamed protein product [Symbiodinium natans]
MSSMAHPSWLEEDCWQSLQDAYGGFLFNEDGHRDGRPGSRVVAVLPALGRTVTVGYEEAKLSVAQRVWQIEQAASKKTSQPVLLGRATPVVAPVQRDKSWLR